MNGDKKTLKYLLDSCLETVSIEKGLDKISTHKSALDAIKNINGIQSKSRQIIQRQRTNYSQQERKYIQLRSNQTTPLLNKYY